MSVEKNEHFKITYFPNKNTSKTHRTQNSSAARDLTYSKIM